MASANETLRDEAIRHALHAADYDAETVQRIVKLLNSADQDISDKLASGLVKIEERGVDTSPATTKRLTNMLTEVRTINDAVYSKLHTSLEGELTDRASYEASWAGTTLDKTLGLKTSVEIPPASYLKELVGKSPIDGHLLKSWTDTMSANRQARVEQAIRLGLVQGESTDKIVARVMGTKAANYADGILNISRNSAQTLVLTASATVANNARVETYRRSGLVNALKWVSTLDSRTSAICQSRSGMVFPINSAFPQPPAHPRCRSILIPVTPTFRELGVDRDEVAPGKRASMDGQVPADTSMEDWIRAQSPERQAQALKSDERAKLFAAGKVSWTGLFNDAGGYRSIAELRAKEGIVAGGATITPKPAPEPDPEPEADPEPIDQSVRNPAVTDETITVEPRLTIQKQLTADATKNAGDFRYDPVREFRDRKEADFGKASFSTAFSDEATSMVKAIMPELDKIAAKLNVPRIRGIKTITGNGAVGNMGDGVLGLNPSHFNAFASKIGKAAIGAADKAADLSARAAKLADRIDQIRKEISRLSAEGGQADAIDALYKEQTAVHKEYYALSKKSFEAKRQARRVEGQTDFKASEWKPGDDSAKRPFTVDNYFIGMDRARSVMYHEFGHQVHQMYAKKGRRSVAGAPPIERLLDRIWAKVRMDKDATALIRSKYAFTNSKEYFAEQFALYFMGKREWADAEAVKLIEELMNGEHTTA